MNSTTAKYCPVAFSCLVTVANFIGIHKIPKHEKRVFAFEKVFIMDGEKESSKAINLKTASSDHNTEIQIKFNAVIIFH